MSISNDTLDDLADLPDVKTPQYDRSEVTPGIVHIGPSHFARGHLFKYIDRILHHDSQWGIRAISLKSSNVRDALEKQDYLYTITEHTAAGKQRHVVGSLMNITVAQENPKTTLDVLCDPNIKLVTITVTQKGYGHDPSTGTLDFERDDIKQCLESMDAPSTTVGYLVAALERRMQEGAPPLTIMSCDNMPSNGSILRNVVLAYAAQKSSKLRRYIESNITFPSTMVDRIVPTTTETDVFNAQSAGISDEWPIITENFMQWAIEDNFAGQVPDFASVGATVCDYVEPFELMKLRMLNGAHMALGCVGGLAGYEFVDEAMKNPSIHSFVLGFMEEASGTVPNIKGVDFAYYQDELVKRLENPYMKDELVRLARNGTQKINGRVVDTLEDAKANEKPYQHIAFATAAWIQYLKGYDEEGNEIDINDENAVSSGLQQIARNSNGNPQPVMTASRLFDYHLMNDKHFMADVTRHLQNIGQWGVIRATEEIYSEPQQDREAAYQKG